MSTEINDGLAIISSYMKPRERWMPGATSNGRRIGGCGRNGEFDRRRLVTGVTESS
jgi:hypothetical protein